MKVQTNNCDLLRQLGSDVDCDSCPFEECLHVTSYLAYVEALEKPERLRLLDSYVDKYGDEINKLIKLVDNLSRNSIPDTLYSELDNKGFRLSSEEFRNRMRIGLANSMEVISSQVIPYIESQYFEFPPRFDFHVE